MFSEKEFQILLPLACAWAEEQGRIILRVGVPLTAAQFADAQTIGVAHPEKVRLLPVETIPLPRDPVLQAAARSSHLVSPVTAGLTLRHAIYIRADCWGDRRLVFHELVHTMQYERLGGFQNFLQQYLVECLTVGYPNGALEQEAVATTARLCA